jgi:uncharacterized protein (TIGR03118 family)
LTPQSLFNFFAGFKYGGKAKMQVGLDRHTTRNRLKFLALSILTLAVATFTSQVRSTIAASVSSYKVVNLVGSEGTGAKRTDSQMINAWGLAFISADGGTPFWINDEGTGVSELIDGKGKTFKALPLVTIPGATAGSTGKPTGIVGNATGLFPIPGNTSALFIFDTEEGTIAGWNESSGTSATTIVTNPGKDYTGLAQANNQLYAANVAAPGSIDVFDSNFNPVTTPGGFSDPSLPTGFTPYNIAAIDGHLFVAYSMGTQPVGRVDEFNSDGTLMMTFTDPSLNAPWGLTLAPSHFGTFSNDLLVGNKGDGTISVFNPANGEFLGQLANRNSSPLVIQDLWAVVDGAGATNASPDAVYFTAGPGGYAQGVFGTIEVGPDIKTNATETPKPSKTPKPTKTPDPMSTPTPIGPYGITPMGTM